MSTLADIVAQLESGSGVAAGSQPATMVDPVYGQYAGFVKQYGAGAAGIDNYANQLLKANPSATLGDFYSSYVLGTGNPKSGYNVGDLASLYPSAYSNLINNAGVSAATPLGSLVGSGSSSGSTSSAGGGGGVVQGIEDFLSELGKFSGWITPGAPAVAGASAAAKAGSLGNYLTTMLFSSRLMMLIIGTMLIGAGALGFILPHSEDIASAATEPVHRARRIARRGRSTAGAAAEVASTVRSAASAGRAAVTEAAETVAL